MLRIIKGLDQLKGKTVLVRCNFDVPLENNKVKKTDAWRIDSVIPFLSKLSGVGAKTVVISHTGRPDGQDESLSMSPIFDYLKISFKDKIFFKKGSVQNGEILLKENLRFDPREQKNEESFARELAGGADVFVNNDFATAHRAHSSTSAITKLLPSYAGPLLEREVKTLESVVRAEKTPLVFAIGGAKSDTKIKIISNFLEKSDSILVGGVLANTILKQKGTQTGKSIVGKEILEDDIVKSEKIVLPVDVVTSVSVEKAEDVETKSIYDVGPDEFILDIGPKTIEIFKKRIAGASQVVWNGPMGLVEIDEFRKGSRSFADIFSKSKAETIAGGGDIVAFLAEEGHILQISHVSTGGGAMLEFLAENKLPALEALGYYDEK